jgi:hypothetical protein
MSREPRASNRELMKSAGFKLSTSTDHQFVQAPPFLSSTALRGPEHVPATSTTHGSIVGPLYNFPSSPRRRPASSSDNLDINTDSTYDAGPASPYYSRERIAIKYAQHMVDEDGFVKDLDFLPSVQTAEYTNLDMAGLDHVTSFNSPAIGADEPIWEPREYFLRVVGMRIGTMPLIEINGQVGAGLATQVMSPFSFKSKVTISSTEDYCDQSRQIPEDSRVMGDAWVSRIEDVVEQRLKEESKLKVRVEVSNNDMSAKPVRRKIRTVLHGTKALKDRIEHNRTKREQNELVDCKSVNAYNSLRLHMCIAVICC